jgi:transcriptional regulator with XRE-family HTH domain
MAERKSVSMQDLADKLGISKVTVSKALNGKDGVGEELKRFLRLRENPVMSFRTTENGRAKKSVSS